MITDKEFKKCHADINGCKIAVSDDEKKCIVCDKNNKEVIESKKCKVCTDYYLKEEQSCEKTCSKP
jgi:hypothetical protein